MRIIAADTDERAIPRLVKCALGLVAFRSDEISPESVFRLAVSGEIEAATRRLSLFDVDLDWQRAALLVIALQGGYADPDGARKLREQVPVEPGADGPLQMLAARLDADLDGAPPPAFELPTPPGPGVAEAMLARTGGVGYSSELLTARGIDPGLAAGGDAAPVYMAQQDGPYLVAYAAANPDEGTELFQRYLAVHTGYYYVEYRRNALWYLLDALLRHPNPGWVLTMLPPLAAGALAGSSVEFRESLPLTIRALRVAAGDGGAQVDLNSRKDTMLADAHEMIDQATAGRWMGDVLGFHKRRLTVLAEAYGRVLGEAGVADELLEAALDVPYGFAGFQYRACLTLAEGASVCQPGDRPRIEQALQASEQAVHNIQQPVFCARGTARYNALRRRWWGEAGFDVAGAIEGLVRSPSAPDFAAVHEIGDEYAGRPTNPSERMPMGAFSAADTLGQLASLFKRPLDELQRLNSEFEWEVGQALDPGTEVLVPDPGMPAQLAPRFAAAALALEALSDEGRIELLQSLVPVAAASPTALDTVLARLVLASRDRLTSAGMLDELTDACSTASWEPVDPLAEMLTSFVP